MRVRLVIATPLVLFHDALRSMFEAAWQFCTVIDAGVGLEAAFRATQLQPDLLLLDYSLSPALPRDVLRTLTTSLPVIALTESPGEFDDPALLALGVCGVIDKRSRASDLLALVHSVLIDTGDAGVYAPQQEPDQRRPSARSARTFTLTVREREVLALVAAAHPNREIAHRLVITEDTVKRHLTSVFDKTGVSNRVELALFAAQHHLLADSLPPRIPTARARSAVASR
jgi:DNA-binding NarL/FixJ family response regulator